MNYSTEKNRILKEVFGHESFRPGQERIVNLLLDGRDVVCIMPTGAGKSMCYQIPALIMKGVTIVVSPLISLMHDQVLSLVGEGVAAAYVNSSLTLSQYRTVLDRMSQGQYKLVYVAPERLSSDGFLRICKNIDISMVAIDESHCVSQWGQDFRPSYLTISDFIDELPKRPVVGAFTATATENVKSDIIKYLKLHDPESITTGFDRPNLFFSVVTPNNKVSKLLAYVKERRGLSGIVYCMSRKRVESVCDILNKNGFSAVRYHAGLDEQERKKNQDDFVYDRAMVMVATNAFGMGIDKSNVSYVIHYNMPGSIENYYQEAGRAGRDGSEAECILMYSPSDVRNVEYFISRSEPNEHITPEEQIIIRQRDEMRLKKMTFYCTTGECLRGFILKYFGEKKPGYCGKCSNCLNNYESKDITVDSQKVLSCIARTRQKYGVKMIVDILKGKKDERIVSLGFDKLSTYGIMSDSSESYIRSVINALLLKDYLQQTTGEYPILRFTVTSECVLKGETAVATRVLKEKQPKTSEKSKIVENPELYELLRELRKRIASSASVPAYVVFTDAALKEMSARMPTTTDEFAQINGVGRVKIQKYGEEFLKEIRDYKDKKQS